MGPMGPHGAPGPHKAIVSPVYRKIDSQKKYFPSGGRAAGAFFLKKLSFLENNDF